MIENGGFGSALLDYCQFTNWKIPSTKITRVDLEKVLATSLQSRYAKLGIVRGNKITTSIADSPKKKKTAFLQSKQNRHYKTNKQAI
jgi:ribosomal protein L21